MVRWLVDGGDGGDGGGVYCDVIGIIYWSFRRIIERDNNKYSYCLLVFMYLVLVLLLVLVFRKIVIGVSEKGI